MIDRLDRNRLVALVVILVVASLISSCGGSDRSSTGGDAPSPSAPSDPTKVVESGSLEFVFTIDNDTREEEAVIHASGSFSAAGTGKPPTYTTSIESSLGNWDGQLAPVPLPHHAPEIVSGLTRLPDQAALQYKGTTYRLDPSAIEFSDAETGPCRDALGEIEVDRLVKSKGRAVRRVGAGSTELTVTSGSLDVSAARRMLRRLRRSACGPGLEAAFFPLKQLEVTGSDMKRFKVESQVEATSAPGGSFHGFSIRVFLHPKSSRDHEYDFQIALNLGAINEDREVPPPAAGQSLESSATSLGAQRAENLQARARGLAGLFEAALGG